MGFTRKQDVEMGKVTWRGKGKTFGRPAVFTAGKDFMFGGQVVVKWSVVKQFETKNFGFTSWVTPKGEKRLAKE